MKMDDQGDEDFDEDATGRKPTADAQTRTEGDDGTL